LENNQQSNTTLILKAQRGNAEALKLLYDKYNKAMFNICTRLMGNNEDAEDVLHDAFIIAFKSLHQLKEAAQFGGWIKRIVINECIKQGKKKKGWDEWEDEKHDVLDEDQGTWWDGVTMAQIHKQIKALPDGCRQIFTLYAVENYSHKDIAESLGVSEGTSKSQYHRAKQLLRERLCKGSYEL
jgi:RNA polymerase sigma-70 factor (ECF subfamily)